MLLRIPCSCGRTFAVGESFVGREVRCTYCGATHTAPEPGAPSPSPGTQSKCPHCGHSIEAGQTACPFCNENLVRHREKPRAEPVKAAPSRSCRSCRAPLGPADSLCPRCGEAAWAAPAAPGEVEKYILWEDTNRGVFSRYWNTWAESQFKFDEFFARMPLEGGLGAPLKFVLFLSLQMVGLACLFGIPLMGFLMLILENGNPGPGVGSGMGIVFGIVLLYIVLAFVGQVVGTFIWAAIYHLSALMFGGRGTFEATYRSVCYSSGAQVWGLAPGVGGLAYLVFHVICMTHALHYSHRISKGRACFATLLPAICCCGLLFVLFLVLLSVVSSQVSGSPM